jgi:hypothetical protein
MVARDKGINASVSNIWAASSINTCEKCPPGIPTPTSVAADDLKKNMNI